MAAHQPDFGTIIATSKVLAVHSVVESIKGVVRLEKGVR